MPYYPKLMNYGLLMNDKLPSLDLYTIQNAGIYSVDGKLMEELGFSSFDGLKLTYVIEDELVGWEWSKESRTMYFQYCEADIHLCNMLYGLFVGPPMLEDIAAFNVAIWKKEN